MLADLLLTNARVWSPGAPISHAIAVAEGRVVATGDAALQEAGPGTTVVDLDGRFVSPGFQDAHVHPGQGGLVLLSCDLLDAPNRQEALERIRAYAAQGSGWVTGAGWKYEWFPGGEPAAEILDALTGDRPTYLEVADGHSAWVNTAALAAAGITDTTADSPDGRIVRLPGGLPQGTLHEGAMALVEAVIPPPSEAELDEGLLAGQAYLLSFGITAWQDACVTPEVHESYLRLASSGRLSATVRGAQWWERGDGLEQLEGMKLRRAQASGKYAADAVKLMLDGVVENFTARLLEPYFDADGGSTDNVGIDMLDRAALPKFVTEIMRAGFQPHFHAIGDGAVRLALDSVESARAHLGPVDVRPHIAHLQVVHPEDVPRFGALGVVPNIQALWAVNDAAMTEMTIPFLGDTRAGWQYPFDALAESAGRLAMGSDWSVSTPNVMEQMSVAVRRSEPLRSDAAPFLPGQALSGEQVLTGFTAGSAWVNGVERERGSLESGMMADLAILSDDPLRVVDPASVSVTATLVDGEVVYGEL